MQAPLTVFTSTPSKVYPIVEKQNQFWLVDNNLGSEPKPWTRE